MDCSIPGLPVHHQLPEFTQTHVHRVGDAIQPSHPLSSPSPPDSIFPSITGLSNEPVLLIRWPNDWSFSFSTSPSDEYSGLISFRMNWLDLLAVQGTLKSLLQHHAWFKSINSSALSFLYSPTSHPYMTTGKTIALTRWTFVGKVMSLLYNVLSRLVITFLPRSKRLLISWLQLSSAAILEPQKMKSAPVSTVYHEVMGPGDMTLVFWMFYVWVLSKLLQGNVKMFNINDSWNFQKSIDWCITDSCKQESTMKISSATQRVLFWG